MLFKTLAEALEDGAFAQGLDELDLEYCFYSLDFSCRKQFVNLVMEDEEGRPAIQKWLKWRRITEDDLYTNPSWIDEYEIRDPQIINMFNILLSLNYEDIANNTLDGPYKVTDYGKLFSVSDPISTINIKAEFENNDRIENDPYISIAFFTKGFNFAELSDNVPDALLKNDDNSIDQNKLKGRIIQKLNDLIFVLVQF